MRAMRRGAEQRRRGGTCASARRISAGARSAAASARARAASESGQESREKARKAKERRRRAAKQRKRRARRKQKDEEKEEAERIGKWHDIGKASNVFPKNRTHTSRFSQRRTIRCRMERRCSQAAENKIERFLYYKYIQKKYLFLALAIRSIKKLQAKMRPSPVCCSDSIFFQQTIRFQDVK